MVGSNGTMIAIRLVRSKLRKREEHGNSVHPTTTAATATDVVLQTTPQLNGNVTAAPGSPREADLTYRGQFLWTQPPPPATQYLYSHNQETLVQNLPSERQGFVRGFRKNLGGKWRRLVKKKSPQEVYTIPAELKPQLKQIYVY